MNILIAGESWMKSIVDFKGFNYTTSSYYEEAVHWFKNALEREGIGVTYLPSHVAQIEFPGKAEELKRYDAIILSDIGSGNLLLHPDTLNKSVIMPNRLIAIRDYVADGGGFAMIGGWMSFQGAEGRAKYKDTEIEEILPVELMPYDDRVEIPQGARVDIVNRDHPVLDGVDEEWPLFLGYNRLKAREGKSVIAMSGKDVFIAAGEFGKGRTFAFASDIAPHWATQDFLSWNCYGRFWTNVVKWLARRI